MKIWPFLGLVEKSIFSQAENNETENDPAVDLALKISPRIIGGDESSGYPWLAAIWAARDGVQCGGAMIHEEFLLTAAHCVLENPYLFDSDSIQNIDNLDAFLNTLIFDSDISSPMQLKIGMLNQQQSTGDSVVTRTIKSAHCHPDFYPGANDVLMNDICLLRLDNPILEEEAAEFPRSHLFHRHICLPEPDSVPETECTVAGWGLTDPDSESSRSSELQEVIVPQVPYETCSLWYAEDGINLFDSNHICFGYEQGQRDSCQGDSGGPLVCKNLVNNRYEVHGITSFASDCGAAKRPGVYARVQTYNDWIIDTVNRVNPNANFTSSYCSSSIKTEAFLFLYVLTLFIFSY